MRFSGEWGLVKGWGGKIIIVIGERRKSAICGLKGLLARFSFDMAARTVAATISWTLSPLTVTEVIKINFKESSL
jgi:hypothetical protein